MCLKMPSLLGLATWKHWKGARSLLRAEHLPLAIWGPGLACQQEEPTVTAERADLPCTGKKPTAFQLQNADSKKVTHILGK